MSQIITLTCDEDAFQLIEQINSGQLDSDEIELAFDGWPRINLHVEGENYHNSITPSMMKAFLELQKGIHRAYAVAQYGTYNTSRLTDDEKKRLELAIGVEDGSSNFDINLQEILEKGFGKAVAKMSSRELIFLIIVIGMLYTGDSAYNAYLQDRKEARIAEVAQKEQIEMLETMQFMSKQETERMKILKDLVEEHPALENVQRHAYDTKTEVFKRAGTADSIEFNDTRITGEDAQLLTRNAKRKSEVVRLDGAYRLLEVNSSLLADFKVKIMNTDSGESFWAKVQDTTLTTENKKALVEAEWGKYPVKLKINAKNTAGTISNAQIINVKELTAQEIQQYKTRHGQADNNESPDSPDPAE